MEKKREKYLTLILIITGFIFLIFFTINFNLTGNVIEEPPTPDYRCSNQSIIDLWNFVFQGGSNNLTIFNLTNYSEDSFFEITQSKEGMLGCPIYAAYQLNGNNLKILQGMDLWLFTSMEAITAINIELTSEGLSEFSSQSSNASYFLQASFLESLGNKTTSRSISEISEAQTKFESTFKVSSESWEKDYLNSTSGNLTIFGFNESALMENLTIFGEEIDPSGVNEKVGMIYATKNIDIYIFLQVSINGMLANLAKDYENWTSPINTSLNEITIKVNNTKFNILGDYSQEEDMEIFHKNKSLIKVKINLYDLDLTNVTLKTHEQDSSSDVGYIIINGLNASKNITLDKLNEDSESVCIKDSEIQSITEISADCNLSDEYLLDCPGTLESYSCEIINNSFFVTGLMHSAVTEFLPSQPNICVPNWDCQLWTNQKEQCGYRNCLDLNNCGNISDMPLEYKECPIVCTPSWDCSDWSPEKCPKEEKKTRNCVDLNNCNSEKNKPSETLECEYKSNILIWILLGLLVFLIGLILMLSLTSSRKNKPIQRQTHNPNPDDEIHEHELPQNQQYQIPPVQQQKYKPINQPQNDFQEFRNNKRLKQPQDFQNQTNKSNLNTTKDPKLR